MHRRTFLTSLALASTAGCTTKTDSSAAPSRTEATPTPETSGPVQRSIGESYSRSNGATIVVASARFSGAARLDDGTTITPKQGNALILADVRSANTSESVVNLPSRDSLALITGGSQYRPLKPKGKPGGEPTLSFPLGGTLYETAEDVHPNVTALGWVFFEVPADSTDFRISLSDSQSSTLEAYWEGTVDPSSLPDVEITSLDVPEEHVNGDPIEFSVSVTNTGGSAGLFNQRFSVVRSTEPNASGGVLDTTVESGETVTIERTVPAKGVQDVTIAVPPAFEKTTHVVPTKAQFGSSHELPNGVKLRVSKPTVSDTVWVDENGSGFENHSIDRRSFAVFKITAWNPTDSTISEPDKDWFEVEGNGFVDSNSNRGFARGLREPVEMPYFRGSRELSPGETTNGVLYFDVPKNTSVDEIACRVKWPVTERANKVCEWKMGE